MVFQKQENRQKRAKPKIISVSLPIELWEFAKKNNLPCSKLLQGALKRIELEKNGELLNDNAALRLRVETLSENLHKAMKILEKGGLTDEFLEENED